MESDLTHQNCYGTSRFPNLFRNAERVTRHGSSSRIDPEDDDVNLVNL
jgi:hypothetical protein